MKLPTCPVRDAHRKRCRRSLCCSVFRRAANFSSKLSMDILLFSQRLSKLRAWLTVFTSTTQHHRHIAMKRQYTHLPTARKMLQESNPHKEQHQEIHDKVTRFSSTPLQKRSKSRHHLSSQKPIAGRGQISELKHSTQQHKSYSYSMCIGCPGGNLFVSVPTSIHTLLRSKSSTLVCSIHQIYRRDARIVSHAMQLNKLQTTADTPSSLVTV